MPPDKFRDQTTTILLVHSIVVSGEGDTTKSAFSGFKMMPAEGLPLLSAESASKPRRTRLGLIDEII